MDKEKVHACPECGADGHIYGKADIYLDGDTWRILAIEEEMECTECDTSFFRDEVPGIPDPSSLCDAPSGEGEQDRTWQTIGEEIAFLEAAAAYSERTNAPDMAAKFRRRLGRLQSLVGIDAAAS